MDSRRDRFRNQLARLAGTTNPKEAIDAGFYVPRPTSSERLVRRIELQPKAIRVLTGPIGSGKSTELLVLAEGLEALRDIWSIVIDVSLLHDLGDLREGTLIASAWLSTKDHLGSNLGDDSILRTFAYGQTTSHVNVFVPGALTPPELKFAIPIDKVLRHIGAVAIARHQTPVFLFDSLDRVRDSTGFRTVLEKDARALVAHGFGVVLTAPLDTLWSDSGELRAMTETWDVLPYEDPSREPEAHSFLLEVLKRRADPGILPESTWLPLVKASGGVLRDLIELARGAVEEAYLAGRNIVGPGDIDTAIADFARALSLGLDGDAISTLLSVQSSRRVRAFDEPTLRLLKNRQILEHRDASGSYFEPHPSLTSLLRHWAEAS